MGRRSSRIQNRFRHWHHASRAELLPRSGVDLVNVRMVLLAVAFGASVIFKTDWAFADRVPGTAYAGRQVHFTTQMDLIEFALWPDLGKKTIIPPVAKFRLPRAYIFNVRGETGENRYSLSSSINASGVGIMLTYPDGLPFSHAIREYRKKIRTSSSQAGRALRSVRMTAHLNSVLGNANKLPILSSGPETTRFKRDNYLGIYSGYRRYSMGTSLETFYGPETALIRKMICNDLLANALPRRFCTYYVVLNTHLIAFIKFVDFRVNGGVEFAEKRVRTFLATICPYVTCDHKSSRYNTMKIRK